LQIFLPFDFVIVRTLNLVTSTKFRVVYWL